MNLPLPDRPSNDALRIANFAEAAFRRQDTEGQERIYADLAGIALGEPRNVDRVKSILEDDWTADEVVIVPSEGDGDQGSGIPVEIKYVMSGMEVAALQDVSDPSPDVLGRARLIDAYNTHHRNLVEAIVDPQKREHENVTVVLSEKDHAGAGYIVSRPDLPRPLEIYVPVDVVPHQVDLTACAAARLDNVPGFQRVVGVSYPDGVIVSEVPTGTSVYDIGPTQVEEITTGHVAALLRSVHTANENGVVVDLDPSHVTFDASNDGFIVGRRAVGVVPLAWGGSGVIPIHPTASAIDTVGKMLSVAGGIADARPSNRPFEPEVVRLLAENEAHVRETLPVAVETAFGPGHQQLTVSLSEKHVDTIGGVYDTYGYGQE